MNIESVLTEIEPQIRLYLIELARLMNSITPEERTTFELTAQNRLATAQAAVDEMRQKYELPDITDYHVLSFGIAALIKSLPVFKGSIDRRDADLAVTVETALGHTLKSAPGVTLRGLLAEAMAYQPPAQYR